MRTVLLALISMISFNIAYAQYNIEGVVVGEQSNQPLEFVNVLIVKNNDSVITGSITDAQGKFKLNVQEGTYTIKVERFGEMLFSKEIAVNQNINLGKIAVKEVSELSDVTVVGRRAVVEVKPDRLVFNTENTAVGKGGGSAINALKATPGVIVQQKEIGIVGKSAVKVYINNRPIKMSSEELTAYLSGLAAKDIKNIEVITMPGAKYEVQGNTGIINIVLKKTPQNHWKDHLSSGYNRWSGSFFNLRNNFSYSKEKINVSFSVSKDFINTDKIDKIKVYYPSQIWDSDVNPKFVEDNWNTRFGLDYKINPKGVLGVTYSGTLIAVNRPTKQE